MITEDYCDFEIAKLLKEKGFDAELKMYWSMGTFDIPIIHCCPQHLVDDGEELMPIEIDNSGIECTSRSNPWKPEEFECIAPTLQMAMKWLREVHGLHISLEPCYDYDSMHVVFLAFVQNVADVHEFFDGRKNIASYPNVEKSYELAIKYCLENLI